MVLDVVSMINFVPLQTGPFEYIAVNVTDSIQFIIHAGLFGTVHSSLGTGVHIFMYMILINTWRQATHMNAHAIFTNFNKANKALWFIMIMINMLRLRFVCSHTANKDYHWSGLKFSTDFILHRYLVRIEGKIIIPFSERHAYVFFFSVEK